MNNIKIFPAGDSALVAEFGSQIDPHINDQVQTLAGRLQDLQLTGILEMVPTFRSLLIHYDPLVLHYNALESEILKLQTNTGTHTSVPGRILEIPCCYGSHFGPDLPDMQKYTKLTRDEIIALHSGTDYRVYMLGFLPGFVYLGGLDPRIEMPRLATPRVRIPRGAVGIGGSQTGVYPLDSPGGWRLIGSTPVDFYDPDRSEPVLCRAGDVIRFVPVTSCDYYDIRQEILRGTYKVTIHEAVPSC